MRRQRLCKNLREAEKEPQSERKPEEEQGRDMEIVTQTEAETEVAPRGMQGDIWSRCRADPASERGGGQSLGRERKRAPVREMKREGKWRYCRRTAETQRCGDTG